MADIFNHIFTVYQSNVDPPWIAAFFQDYLVVSQLQSGFAYQVVQDTDILNFSKSYNSRQVDTVNGRKCPRNVIQFVVVSISVPCNLGTG